MRAIFKGDRTADGTDRSAVGTDDAAAVRMVRRSVATVRRRSERFSGGRNDLADDRNHFSSSKGVILAVGTIFPTGKGSFQSGKGSF